MVNILFMFNSFRDLIYSRAYYTIIFEICQFLFGIFFILCNPHNNFSSFD